MATQEELQRELQILNEEFVSGNWKVNEKGAAFIASEFNRERILGELTQKLREIISENKK